MISLVCRLELGLLRFFILKLKKLRLVEVRWLVWCHTSSCSENLVFLPHDHQLFLKCLKYFKEGTLRGEGGPPVHGGWAPEFGSLSRHDTGLCMDANRRQWCRIRRWTAVDQARPLQGTSRKGSPAQRPALKPFHLGDLGLNFLIFVQVPW